MSELLLEHPDKNSCLVYLLRHGATPPNLLDPPIMQGKGIDEPLAGLGRKQAACVGAELASRPLRAIYSSPLLRAIETAELVAEPHGLPVEPVEPLTEVEVGRWEGLTWPQVEQFEPKEYRAFRDDPGVHGYPGGETLANLHARVTPALEELMQRHIGEEIAVVAHSVVNRVYLGQLLGLSLAGGRAIAQTNCAINLLRWREGRAKAISINAIGHLM
jgi:broad specificity phosphatase PhoE